MSKKIDEYKKQLDLFLRDLESDIIRLSDKIHENPELGHQEYYASKLLADYLSQQGFAVERNIAGLETAFLARYASGRSPRIALLAEYDALPEIGHGCGHNLIGAAAVGAATAVKILLDVTNIKGQVVVMGTPAEETSGGKVTMVEKGYFQDIDAAMMFHPGDSTTVETKSLAMDALEFTFIGKSAHAAVAPYISANALDAVVNFYNGVNAMRQYLEEDMRVHGVIIDGGNTPNVIPDRAVTRWYIRAANKQKLKSLTSRIIECASGAAMMAGAKVKVRNYELSYDEMVTNKRLAGAFRRNLREVGSDVAPNPSKASGSIDMGNVSQVVPAIHPYLSFEMAGGCMAHTEEFAKASGSVFGSRLLMRAAKVMAYTTIDLMVDKELMSGIRSEFKSRRD
ncbi:amidohydrolase [Desulfitispora alkaliphila]|uniref:M20 family metallopeptidase n=1 Tax=Desulfitispora alkaliphila TaxID=622674 RepID=UPI003D262348